MRKKILELQNERAAVVAQARAVFDKAEREKRDMTAAESDEFNSKMAAEEKLKKEIDAQAAVDTRATRLSEVEADLQKSNGRQVYSDPQNKGAGDSKIVKFEKRLGHTATKHIELSGPASTPEYRKAFQAFLQSGSLAELRALQVDLDVSGGFLVAPQEFLARVIQAVDDQVFIRQLANVMTLTGATSLGVPTRDADVADSDWTSELATGGADTSLIFGKRELQPHPLAKQIKISNKLLRASAIDVEQYVIDRLAYKFGITQEKAFMTGDGIQKPLGIFTASSSGISTARDFQTGSATNFTADGLIKAKYKLKPQYWADARWVFHRDAVSLIRQLKDVNGQYLWSPSGIGQASLAQGAPDTILNLPVITAEYAPNTFTTGLYVGILGDFDEYWIVEALGLQMQRLVELYAATNQVGLIGRAEIDGAPVLEEAFVRLITN